MAPFSVLVMLQQLSEGGCFSERVFHLEGKELASAWDQRTSRKVASDGATQ